jgi:hypothetical protein
MLHAILFAMIDAICPAYFLVVDLVVIIAFGEEYRLCGPVVRVPGYRKYMYCVSCEVRTEFIYVM